MWGKRIVVLLAVSFMMWSHAGVGWAQMQMQSPSLKMHQDMRMSSGGGGGPSLLVALFDFTELEKALLPASPKFEGDLVLDKNKLYLLWGGGGFGGPGRLRFGGGGWGGEWTVSYPMESKRFDQAKLTVEGGGFTTDLLLADTNRLDLSVGVSIGGSDITLLLDNKVSKPDWDELIKGPKSLEMSRSYLMIEPYVSVQLRLTVFMGLRLSAGYLLQTSFGEWELKDETQAKNGPLKTLTAPVFSVMLFFGK
jgi:hypothetical protein